MVKFSTSTIQRVSVPELASTILLIARQQQLERLVKDAGIEYGQFDPVYVALSAKLEAVKAILQHTDRMDSDEYTALEAELEAGPNLYDLLIDLIEQYRAAGVAPTERLVSMPYEMIDLCIGYGVTSEDLKDGRKQRVITMLEGSEEPISSEDQVGKFINLTGKDLKRLLSEMVADDQIVKVGDGYTFPNLVTWSASVQEASVIS